MGAQPVIRWSWGLVSLLLAACAATPKPERSPIDVPADVVDRRSEFAALFCAELEAGGRLLPDFMPCEEALSPLAPLPDSIEP